MVTTCQHHVANLRRNLGPLKVLQVIEENFSALPEGMEVKCDAWLGS